MPIRGSCLCGGVRFAHLFDDDPKIRPVLHEHVSGKPAWYEITDGLPRYAEAPPLAAFFPKDREA